jgi:DNA-directed RNA polymerase specialized sigma24 family protein
MRSDELASLYVQFAGRLARIVGGCFDASDAVIEDACQAAWTRLIEHRRRMILGTAPGWLIRTALHEARRLSLLEARDDSLELELGEDPGQAPGLPAPGSDELVARRERLRSVGALPTRQQRLVWLLALGLSYDEMAWHEQCTSRTVHRQLERARRRLRALDEAGLKRPSLSGPVRACDASAQPG